MTPGDDAFPTVEPERVAVFDALDERRRLSAGDYLYREGDASYDFYVIRSGAVEILARTESAGGRVIVWHGPGQFSPRWPGARPPRYGNSPDIS